MSAPDRGFAGRGGRHLTPTAVVACVLALAASLFHHSAAAGEVADGGGQCALPSTGADAASPAAVIHLPAARVEAAFARGEPLLETADYKIHASRREAPGLAEVHTHDTDILHVLQGAAILVTGGRAVDARATAPEELRGPAIEGGEERRIGPGDVIVVPSGVPHWFMEVEAPLLYYVVKVRRIPADMAGESR